MDNKFNKLLRSNFLLYIVAVAIYLIAAINLVGYFHPDEHYQILEFANYKLGKIDSSQMPWEFNYEMRSSFQPWIAFLIIKLFSCIHIFNPYTITLTLRVISATLSLFAIIRFNNVILSEFDTKVRPFYKWISLFLWFIPYLSVRFSSEVWSAIFFLLALGCLLPNKKCNYKYSFVGGLFLGLSYLCRFQTAIIIFGLIFWLVFIQKRSMRQMVLLVVSIFLVMLFGVYIDYLYYGDWTLSAWNYFNMNIIYDKASNFGSVSIYSFLRSVAVSMILPIGLLILYCFIVLALNIPRSFVIWCSAPLIVLHLLIPHKEVRFLFPIVYFLPYIIVKGLNILVDSVPNKLVKNWQRISIRSLFLLLIVGNIVCLIVAIFSPPLNGRIVLAKYIYDNYSNIRVDMFAKKSANPLNPYSSLRQSFYEVPKVDYIRLNNFDTIPMIASSGQNVKLLVIRRRDFSNPTIDSMLDQSKITILKSGSLPWLFCFKDFLGRSDNEFLLCEFN